MNFSRRQLKCAIKAGPLLLGISKLRITYAQYTKMWSLTFVIGVDRANQFDLIEIAGDPLNAFYIERSVGLKRLVPAVIHRLHEIDRFRIRQELG